MDYTATLSQTETFLAYQASESLRIEKQRAHEETETALKLLKEEHFDIISDQHDKHWTAVKALNNDILELNDTINSLNGVINNEKEILLQEKEDRKKNELILANNMELLRKEFDLNIENEKKMSEKILLETLEKVASSNEELNSGFVEECEKYSRLLLAAQVEYKELEDRWRKRDSLPEDLNRIIQLENEMIDKDELVVRTREEMLYFKREMLNREENFNQKFNRTPNVGVMQVIKSTELGTSMNVNNGVGTLGTINEKNSTLKNPVPGGFGGRKSSKPTFFVAPGGGVASMGTLGMGMGSGTMSPATNSPGKVSNTTGKIQNNLNNSSSNNNNNNNNNGNNIGLKGPSRRQSSS